MTPCIDPMASPFMQLHEFGQSPWYGSIRRELIASGELHKLIEVDGLSGVTSNASMFEKAIAGSSDYDSSIDELAHHTGHAKAIYEALAIADVQNAADLLYPIYET